VSVLALALVLVSLGAGDHDRSLTVGVATRTYVVQVPPRVSEGRPLPVVLAFHGGGVNASGFKAYAGLELQKWVARDRCPAEPRTVEQRTTPSRGGPDHTATLLVWGPCAGGTEVQLWKLTVAGHGWPGGHVRPPEKIIGPETVPIDAALEVWRFVSRFRRPDAPAPDAR